MAATTQQHANKLPYVEWQGFRNCLHLLRRHYSWGQVSELFKKQDSPGWAERADQHRSQVTEADVKLARELVQQLPTDKPPAPKKKRMPVRQPLTEAEHAEIRTHLNAFLEQYGSWTGVMTALGKNPSGSHHYKSVAAGEANGSEGLLDLLRKIKAEGPVAQQNGAKKRAHYQRAESLDAAGRAEVQQRLRDLYKKHRSWRRVSELVGSGNAKGYYASLAKRGHGGSKTLLNRLRALENGAPAAKVEALQKADDTVPTPRMSAEERTRSVAYGPRPDPTTVQKIEPTPSEPWPLEAQRHLRTALEIVEAGVSTLPKALQAAAGDLTSQIKLAIEELDSGDNDDSDEGA